jgi:molybdopterin converting factor small subunit
VIAVVHLFAGARELAGTASITVELPEGGTVAELRSALRRDLATQPPLRSGEGGPESALAALVLRSRIAVNCEFADDSAVVPDGAELALIPPVSGGSA